MDFPNILHAENYMTQHQYTLAGNLSVNTTRNRIKSRLIASIEIDGHVFIDTEKSPPGKRYAPNKKERDGIARPPCNVITSGLIHIGSYAYKKRITANKFYDAMLSGKVRGLVIAGESFIFKEDLGKIA